MLLRIKQYLGSMHCRTLLFPFQYYTYTYTCVNYYLVLAAFFCSSVQDGFDLLFYISG